MKVETKLWIGVAIYFVFIAVLYAAVGGSVEGVATLIFCAAFGGLVGGWLWHWTKSHPSPPSELSTADVGDAAPEVGVFPSSSVRPVAIAAAMCMIMLGVPLGLWAIIAGVMLLAWQVGLMVRDRDS